MLPIPQSPGTTINIVGLDPGSNTFGIALLTVELGTLRIVASDAWTIVGEKLAGKSSWNEELHGGRVSRLAAIENNLLRVFTYCQPLIIASESPFINNRFPQAGIALTEVLCAVRSAVMKYDVWRELYLIPPSSVKNAIHASGAGKKDAVKLAVLQIHELTSVCANNPQLFDEHSIDALAVAYAILQRFRNTIN